MNYANGCNCHGATFCPDLICVGYEDDVPIYVRRDHHALLTQHERAEQRDRSEYARLRAKYEPHR